MGQFEIQVLDSYKAETYADGQAGAIYGQYPPLFNASRPPGEWQAYDIAFRRPRFDASGKLLEPARITLFHNGILVQNNEEPFGPTSWLKWLPYADQGDRGPISLQDHDHPVRYRNIWLRELPERPAPIAKDLARPKVVTLPTEVLDRYVGQYLLNEKPERPEGHDRPRGRSPDRHLPLPTPAARTRADLRDASSTCHSPTAASPSARTTRASDRRPVPDRRRRAGAEEGRALSDKAGIAERKFST